MCFPDFLLIFLNKTNGDLLTIKNGFIGHFFMLKDKIITLIF